MSEKVAKRARAEHRVAALMKGVDATHAHLGNLVVIAALCVKARKLLIIVSPHGCGKSKATSFVSNEAPVKMPMDRLSVPGLATAADDFNDFRGVVTVDDIAKTQGPYARTATMTTLAELVYSHYVNSNMAKYTFKIENFYGSALINIQPVLLAGLVASAEWEASIQDKAIRYYHLYRPMRPCPDMPNVKIDWGIDIDKVAQPNLETAVGRKTVESAKGQWGKARTLEHVGDLLRALAAMDHRDTVSNADHKLLRQILLPLRYEQVVMDKNDFESQRLLHSTRLAMLVQHVTYGPFTMAQTAEDYNMSESQAYKQIAKFTDDWVPVSKHPTRYDLSKRLRERMQDAGLIINRNGTGPE